MSQHDGQPSDGLFGGPLTAKAGAGVPPVYAGAQTPRDGGAS
jgi:hypothetical protein